MKDREVHERTARLCEPCEHNGAEYLAGTVFGGDLPPKEYGGACNLGSLMLHKFVNMPFTPNAQLRTRDLTDAIHTAVRFLDNIIDINTFPSPIYENYQKRYRTIGLGYTGLADALVMMGLRYDSEEARKFVSSVTEFIALEAYKASVELAREKGAFPGLATKQFVESGFLCRHKRRNGQFSEQWRWVVDDIQKYGIRNAKLLSVAPTGTMSLVYGNNCSSGIEPIFSLEYDRRVKMGGQSEENVQTVTVQDYAYQIYQQMKSSGQDVVEEPPFVTALNISVDDHVEMLASIAQNVDMSVSKTINVPTDYPYDDCKGIYEKCWRSGIKGCTIFRPNAIRQGVLIDKSETDDAIPADEFEGLGRGDIICCDDTLVGMKRKLITGCGSMHLMAWFDPASGRIMEVFVGRGGSGGCDKNLTAMTRLISAGLRGGIPFEYIADQLESCGGCGAYQSRRAAHHDTSPGSSCATAIAIALKEMQDIIDKDIVSSEDDQEEENTPAQTDIPDTTPRCPECGSELSFEGGCNICKSCGWSKCG